MDHLYREISECESMINKTVITLKALERIKDTIKNDSKVISSMVRTFTLAKGLKHAVDLIEAEIEIERQLLIRNRDHIEAVKKWIIDRDERIRIAEEKGIHVTKEIRYSNW